MAKLKKKNDKLDKIFKPKSFLFVFNIILVIAILYMFCCWLGVKLTFNKERYFGPMNQPTTVQQGTVTYVDSGTIPYLVKKDGNGNIVDEFKIMSTSDLHLHAVNTPLTLGVLEDFLDKETPDLLVIDGDVIFLNKSTTWVKKMIDMFEQKQQYWTFVLGNHDHDIWNIQMDKWQARQKAFNLISGIDIYGKIADHCLARSAIVGDDISKLGSGTNCINIMGSNGLLQSLFFFDWQAISYKNNDALNWFDNKVNQIIDINGSMPETILFSHVSFVELPKCIKLIGKDNDAHYEYGQMNELALSWGAKENGLFEKLLNLNTKVTCVFGHDHLNNMCMSYKNVRMMFTLTLAYNSYNSRFLFPSSWVDNIAYALDTSLAKYLDGVTIFIIKGGQPTTSWPKYAQFEHVLDDKQGWLYLQTCFAITYNAFPLSITLYILLPLVLAGNITYFVFAGKYLKKQAKKKN